MLSNSKGESVSLIRIVIYIPFGMRGERGKDVGIGKRIKTKIEKNKN